MWGKSYTWVPRGLRVHVLDGMGERKLGAEDLGAASDECDLRTSLVLC